VKRWLSPALLVVLLSLVGGALLYALGRWDQAVDAKWELHRAAVDRALKDGKHARAREDSLRVLQLGAEARADSAERLAQLQASAIAKLQAAVDRETEISVASSIADILPKLRMRPIGHDLYGTDSSGVRFLEQLRLESFQALLVPPLQELVREHGRERDALRDALWLANARADSAGARAVRFEELLRESQKLTSCRIAWVLPCPSRGVMFVAGLAVGAAAVMLGT